MAIYVPELTANCADDVDEISLITAYTFAAAAFDYSRRSVVRAALIGS